MKKKDLRAILKKHEMWIENEEGGERAYLQGENLQFADLRGANLRGAHLQSADLREADLRGAYLQGANLRGAYLQGANLRVAYLQGTDLRGAYLRGSYLQGANLRGANIRGADLGGAYLRDAEFRGAKTDFEEDDLISRLIPICCPDSGSFIAWKKARNRIVKLEVCEDALRSSAFGRICRCSKAFVLKIEDLDGSDSGLTEVSSDYDEDFIYRVGDIVKVKNFDTNRMNECAPGIHFFITRNEAVDYVPLLLTSY